MKITKTDERVDMLVQDAAISDLFFNYDHPAYEAFWAEANHEATQEELDAGERAALIVDADDFIQTFTNATGLVLDAEELADDFLGRV